MVGGVPQVCDFNLSRVMEESAVLSSMAATNPRWLAPEILAGRGYTFSSDVYSFGIILWEFLTWRVPWHEYGPWQVVAMVTDGHQRPEIPQEGSRPSNSSFPGMPEYVRLMQSCWEQVRQCHTPSTLTACPALSSVPADRLQPAIQSAHHFFDDSLTQSSSGRALKRLVSGCRKQGGGQPSQRSSRSCGSCLARKRGGTLRQALARRAPTACSKPPPLAALATCPRKHRWGLTPIFSSMREVWGTVVCTSQGSMSTSSLSSCA